MGNGPNDSELFVSLTLNQLPSVSLKLLVQLNLASDVLDTVIVHEVLKSGFKKQESLLFEVFYPLSAKVLSVFLISTDFIPLFEASRNLCVVAASEGV